MYQNQKFHHYLIQAIIICLAAQADILLLEIGKWVLAPLSLSLCIFFINTENHSPLMILFIASLPLSLIQYQITGLNLCLYGLLFSLQTLFKNSIYLKQLIPYFSLASFLLLQELYLNLYTMYPFSALTFIYKAIFCSLILFTLFSSPLYSILDKKK